VRWREYSTARTVGISLTLGNARWRWRSLPLGDSQSLAAVHGVWTNLFEVVNQPKLKSSRLV